MAPQQPVNPNFMTMLPILAQYMNRKGGANSGDMSNIFNELMGLMSNSYTEPSQMSDEEIQRIYAPQTNAVRGSDDPILQGILADIESGTPALKIKEAIRKGVYDTGTITLATPDDLSMYDSLVDDLFSEKKSVDQERYKIANKETIYEKYGLPDPNEQFDPQQLFPGVYAGLDTELESRKTAVGKKLADIDKAAGSPDVFLEPEKKKGKSVKTEVAKQASLFGAGGVPALLGRNIMGGIGNFMDTSDKSLEEQYEIDLKQISSSFGLSPKQIKEGNGPQEKAARIALQKRRQSTYQDYSKKQKEESPKLDVAATNANKARIQYKKELAGGPATNLKVGNTGGAVTDLGAENLRDPVLQQQKIKELLTKRVQDTLAARGETPFNQALLNRIVLNSSMGK
jgi:hypothetical protein